MSWGAQPGKVDQFVDYPDGEPDALKCRGCGAMRTLEGQNTEPGQRVLVCWVCDVPDPIKDPLVGLESA